MISEQEAFLQWVYRQGYYSGEIDFYDLVRTALKETLNKDDIDAESIASARLTRYRNAAKKRVDYDEDNGRCPSLYFDSEGDRCIWYHSKKESNDFPDIGLRLRNRASFLRLIDTLNDREYEAIACVALYLTGAKNLYLTPKGNEGGVDFYALLEGEIQSHIAVDP